jgi:hypothetical protein
MSINFIRRKRLFPGYKTANACAAYGEIKRAETGLTVFPDYHDIGAAVFGAVIAAIVGRYRLILSKTSG